MTLACRPTTLVAAGEVVGVGEDGRTLTLRRDDLPGMSRALTLILDVPDPALVRDLPAGTHVTVQYTTGAFRTPTLVALHVPGRGPAIVHDHAPHEGGLVVLVGTRHLEARAEADGRVLVYPTDFARRPLPLAGVRGTLRVAGSSDDVPMTPEGTSLVARIAVAGARASVHVALALDGETLATDFVLPVAPGAGGAAAVATERCQPAAATEDDVPRCTIRASAPVSALAISPDGATLLAAVAGAGVSAWRLPDGVLTGALEAPPPTAVRDDDPRADVVTAIAWRPDGGEALVAIEGRVLRYAFPGGRLTGQLAVPGGLARDLAWWPNGSHVAVTALHDAAAHALEVASGREIARYAVNLEATGVAIDPSGATVFVGSAGGAVGAFDARTGTALHELPVSNRAVVSLATDGATVTALAVDGIVRRVDAVTGGLRGRVPVGYTPAPFAVGPRGEVAVGLPSGEVTLVDLDGAVIARTLPSLGDPVEAVAWHGTLLASGDRAGRITIRPALRIGPE